MSIKKVEYKAHDVDATGYIAYPEGIKEKKPAILIAHAWRGLDDFVQKKTLSLRDLGYIAFAADVYGNKKAHTDEEAFALMSPLFIERALLQKRIQSAYTYLVSLPHVDQKRIGAIGFCFGGLTVLELLRSGSFVKAIVSFHGLLGSKLGDLVAKISPMRMSQDTSALFFHGDLDPLVSLEDIDMLKKELTASQVDWQFHIFGNAVHAFTNPEAHDVAKGLSYDQKADKRSWTMMHNFFIEQFQ